jgi:hypothetical protein
MQASLHECAPESSLPPTYLIRAEPRVDDEAVVVLGQHVLARGEGKQEVVDAGGLLVKSKAPHLHLRLSTNPRIPEGFKEPPVPEARTLHARVIRAWGRRPLPVAHPPHDAAPKLHRVGG